MIRHRYLRNREQSAQWLRLMAFLTVFATSREPVKQVNGLSPSDMTMADPLM